MLVKACNPHVIWLTNHLLISISIHASFPLCVNLISTIVSVGRIPNMSFNPSIVFLSTIIQPFIQASLFSFVQAPLRFSPSLCRSPGDILHGYNAAIYVFSKENKRWEGINTCIVFRSQMYLLTRHNKRLRLQKQLDCNTKVSAEARWLRCSQQQASCPFQGCV